MTVVHGYDHDTKVQGIYVTFSLGNVYKAV